MVYLTYLQGHTSTLNNYATCLFTCDNGLLLVGRRSQSSVCYASGTELLVVGDCCLFDLSFFVPVNSFSVISGRYWVEPVLSQDKSVLLKDTTQWDWWGSNPQALGLESSTLPLSHCAPTKCCALNGVIRAAEFQPHSRNYSIWQLWPLLIAWIQKRPFNHTHIHKTKLNVAYWGNSLFWKPCLLLTAMHCKKWIQFLKCSWNHEYFGSLAKRVKGFTLNLQETRRIHVMLCAAQPTLRETGTCAET